MSGVQDPTKTRRSKTVPTRTRKNGQLPSVHEQTETPTAIERDLNMRIYPREYATDPYARLLVEAQEPLVTAKIAHRQRFLLGLPVTGLVRVEFMLARYGQTIPTNWSMADYMYPIHERLPLGYDVKDARNIIVQQAVTQNFEWLFFLDHDVLLPHDCFLKMNEYMRAGDKPLVSGLYFTKSQPAEPLVFRGRGNSYYANWKLGDKFWVDGCGMGCMLLNVKVLREMWQDAPVYIAGGNQQVRQVFDTPQFIWTDPEGLNSRAFAGTEDLSFFDRMRQGHYLERAGFKRVGKQKYFVFLDSSIFAKHITPDGIQYPLELRW